MGLVSPKTAIRWDWIRNKRSLLTYNDIFYNKDKDYHDRKVEEGIDNNICNAGTNKGLNDNDLKINDSQTFDRNDYSGDVENVKKGIDELNEELYEKYFKDELGVYRIRKKRRKRNAGDMKELVMGLRNLPPLQPHLVRIQFLKF